ncbi:MAG: amino acid permease [Nitrospiraceae bacterium]|nr:amino acid permease [Nitrospiraceae bacterium]
MGKGMGLWSAISIGIGGMVGAGIFSILGIACDMAGNAVYISFIIAGGVALLSTYSYAKLGAKFPSAGGPVEFLVRGFGDGVLSGGFNILMWIGYVFALALYARAFAAYSMTFFSNAPQIWLNVSATGIILLFTAVNFIGAKAVGRSELFIVSVKVGILVFFAVVGFFFIKPELLSLSGWPPANDIFFAAAVVFMAYEGFGLITNAAEDMKNPEKTLPKALYLSVIIVIAIYISVSIAVIGNLPLPEIANAKDYALAAAAKPFLGIIGFRIIAIAALFSTSSAINATLYGGANISYMIAKDGELPEIFERKVWGKSTEGLFITAGLVILFANLVDLGGIAMLGSASFLLIYAAVNIAHLRLYKRTGANIYVIWLSIIGCLTAFVILAYYLLGHSMMTLIVLVAVLALSFAVEMAYRKHYNRKLKIREKNRH